MVAAKKDTKDSSAEVKALKVELEKTRKALAEALEQIEKLKEKAAAQPKEKTIKDGHEYVDLGLPSGLLWATCNVGASKPEDFGNYYAWGETSTKSSYMWENSKFFGRSMRDIAGNSNYDAARANWGGKWRLPTKSEMQELMDKCTWEWMIQNGVNGYKVIGPSGASIFLPAAGHHGVSSFYYDGPWTEQPSGSSLQYAGSHGSYWSSTHKDEDPNNCAFYLDFYIDKHSMYSYPRWDGRSVRPVLEDSSAEVKALKAAELEKTRKALAEALEQIEKLKEKETGKPAAQPKEKTIKDVHEYVDLGLPSGLLWATCNVGANAPEEYGDYFAWGETSPKDEYTEDNCSTYEKQINDISGNAQYDAARANWGGKWRLPTISEMQELIDKCTWKWMIKNGVNGYKVTGPSGASIFLPAAGGRYGSSLEFAGILGLGLYWSSSPFENSDYYAYSLGFYSANHSMSKSNRYDGLSVRPVLEDSSAEVKVKAELEKTRKALAEALEQIEKLKEKETGKPAAQPKEKTIKDGHEYVDLGLPSGLKWATCNVGASKPEDFGNYYAWGETSPKDEYTEDNCSTYEKQINDISGNAQYDAARANWGGKWRLPTKSEMQELMDKCIWEWMTQNGVNGYKVTGPSGASIFLPAAGYSYGSSLYRAGSGGCCWSSSPDESGSYNAYGLSFYGGIHGMSDYNRNFGRSVRPVLE